MYGPRSCQMQKPNQAQREFLLELDGVMSVNHSFAVVVILDCCVESHEEI